MGKLPPREVGCTYMPPCDLHTKDSLLLTDINLITHYPSQHCQLKKFVYFFFLNKKRRDVFE